MVEIIEMVPVGKSILLYRAEAFRLPDLAALNRITLRSHLNIQNSSGRFRVPEGKAGRLIY